MSNALLAFLGGMGSGYFGQRDKNVELERQARLDAQATELHNARMDEINLGKKNQAALTAAGQAATVNENATTLDTGAGAKVYDMAGGADIAASDARQFNLHPLPITAAADAAPDAPAPVAAPRAVTGSTYSVNGVGYSPAAGIKAAADYNAPEGRAARIQAAYDATGRPMEAIQYGAAQAAGKLSTLHLSDAELAHANNLYNTAINQEIINNNGDTFAGLASAATKTAVAGLKGSTVSVQTNADGTRNFVTTTPDGNKTTGKTYPKGPEGDLLARQDASKVDPTTKIQWLHENYQAKLAAEKVQTEKDQFNQEIKVKQDVAKAQISSAGASAAHAFGALTIARAEESRKAKDYLETNRLPKTDQLQLAYLETDAKANYAALVKAQAENLFVADSPNAQALLKERANIISRMQAIFDRNPAPKAATAPAPNPLSYPGAKPPAPPVIVKPKMTTADMRKAAGGLPLTQ